MKLTSQTAQLVSQKENKAWPSQSADPKEPSHHQQSDHFSDHVQCFPRVIYGLIGWVVPDIWCEFYVTAPLGTLVMCSVLILPTECE